MMMGGLSNLLPILLLSACFGNQSTSIRHVVQAGESLWEISKKYQVQAESLTRLNPAIKDPNIIFPGQIINIT